MKRLTHLYKSIFTEKQEAELKRRRLERIRADELKLIKGNDKFKDIHKGKRCFIIGNGPSIKNVDFRRLEKEIVFTVNQLPRLDRFPQLHTNYHLWTDARYFDLNENSQGDMELLEIMKMVKTEDNSPTVFYSTFARSMINHFKLDKILNVEYFMDGKIGNELYDIEYPINRMIPVYSTCIHYVILIAIYMGFKEIYLLGCDCTGIINIINSRIEEAEDFEYAYSISENERARMMSVSKKSRIEDEFIWYGNILKVYGVLYKYAQRHGCALYNATDKSIIENVPRVDLNNILREQEVK